MKRVWGILNDHYSSWCDVRERGRSNGDGVERSKLNERTGKGKRVSER